ncbi:MAG: hypothetical protein KAI81_02345 [Candidatus Marinimicrobia bacterium]|nr:hypothetical protein [Candidatus Neomarinimicrobiota bacterium]
MFALIIPKQSNALPLYVHPDNEVLTFLDRMATRGILERFLNDSYPLSRNDVSGALQNIEFKKDKLSSSEKELLRFYLSKFYHEIEGNRHSRLNDRETWWPGQNKSAFKTALGDVFRYQPYEQSQDLIMHQSKDAIVFLNLNENFCSENKNSSHRYIWTDHFEFSTSINKKLGIYVDATRFIQTYQEDYAEPSDSYHGGYLTKLDEGVEYYNYDFSHTYINYLSVYGKFSLSNYPQKWGNSPNSMLLSGHSPAYPALQWSRDFGHSRYSFIHGFLLPAESSRDSLFNNKEYVSKYIVGHRWEISPYKWINIAFSEFIIYGNRSVEPTYLLPMIFLWSAQHNLNNRGNVLMAIEGELFPLPGLKLYGTFFLDELKFSELFNQWWANKQGYQAGLHVTPAQLPWSPDFRAEITYIRPWTYTHEFDFSTFTHNGSGLGFPDGPNSFFVFIAARIRPSVRHLFEFKYRRLLEGQSENIQDENGFIYPIGNDPNQNYNDRNPAFDYATTWIMGEQLLTQQLSLSWTSMLTNVLHSRIELAHKSAKNGEKAFYYHFGLSFRY